MNTSIKVLGRPWNIAEVVPRELQDVETMWGWLPCLVLVTLSIFWKSIKTLLWSPYTIFGIWYGVMCTWFEWFWVNSNLDTKLIEQMLFHMSMEKAGRPVQFFSMISWFNANWDMTSNEIRRRLTSGWIYERWGFSASRSSSNWKLYENCESRVRNADVKADAYNADSSSSSSQCSSS